LLNKTCGLRHSPKSQFGQDRTVTQCCTFTETDVRDTQDPNAANGHGGRMKIIAVVEDQPVIVRILTHLGCPLKYRSQRRDASRLDSFQAA
jgi:hypothetical protein